MVTVSRNAQKTQKDAQPCNSDLDGPSRNLRIIKPHLCVCVCVCVCNILLYIFAFAVYLLVSNMCAKIRVWLCFVTDNFGLFTEIAVCKFLRGWRLCGLKPFLFGPLYVFINFSAAFLYGALCPRSC